MVREHRVVPFPAIGVLLLVTACSGAPRAPHACASDGDCVSPAVCHQNYCRSVWLQLGSPISTTAGGYALEVSPNGQPLVAYEEAPGSGSNVYVKKWNGQSWETLGGSLGSAPATNPVLALDTNGNPTVAWIEGAAAPHSLKVAQWDVSSGAWKPLPGTVTQAAGNDVSHPSLAVTSSGVPWLAYRDYKAGTAGTTPNPSDCAQAWNPTSSSWGAKGCTIEGYGGFLSLKLDSHLTPLLASSWADESGLSLHSLNGATWGVLANFSTSGLEPSLAVNSRGKAIAWKDRRNLPSIPWHIFAKYWNGLTWVPPDLNGSTAQVDDSTSVDSTHAATAVDSIGYPVVAWVEPKVGFFVRRWNGNAWESLGRRLNASTPQSDLAYGPSLATDDNGGNLTVAWSQAGQLIVMQYQ